MKFLRESKYYWGRREIKAHLSKNNRKVKACNIKDAETIGIIFDATNPINFEVVKKMVKNISTKKNSIEVLGYLDHKEMIDHYLYRKGFDFFTRSQLNWFQKPMGKNVESFIKKPYDLLIDLSLENPFPIQYITAFSKSYFKTGKYAPGIDYLDLMIDIEKEKEEMLNLRSELEKDIEIKEPLNAEVEEIVDIKVQTEIQLNFLINQLIHYLSIIKS